MTRTNFDNLCLNCFGTLDGDGVCSACRKKDGKKNKAHHLQKRAVLNKKYIIGKTLGEGGFGITYLAWNLYTKEKVAIKEFFPSGKVSREAQSGAVHIPNKYQKQVNFGLKSFIDEAQILSKIKNLDGIVSVLDFFSENNTAYIVMEFLDGISLSSYLSRKGKLSYDDTLTILHPVITSLKEVHAVGLLHRDISPDNILITKDNKVKLIDFGAAKRIAYDDGGSVVLKQYFAPEEQYRPDGEQGEWTDVYALGVTIYFCITTTLPPESTDRLIEDTLVLPSECGVKITKAKEQKLLKAMAVLSKNRYKSIAEMEKALYPKQTAPTASEPPKTTQRAVAVATPTALTNTGNARISAKLDEQPPSFVRQKPLIKRIFNLIFKK